MLVPEGWYSHLEDGNRMALATLKTAAERRQWEAVARTQRALLDDDRATLRSMLATWSDWPRDAGVDRWLDRLRKLHGVGVAEMRAAGA